MRFKITSVCRKENKIWKTQSHKLCQRGRNHNFSKIKKKIFVVFKILLTLKYLMVILLQKGQALIVIKLIEKNKKKTTSDKTCFLTDLSNNRPIQRHGNEDCASFSH